jgi:DNA replication protein DnaC
LCLDDLGAEKTTEYAITTLYLIIDRRIRNEMQTIITTNLSLDEIEATLGARIASRLAEMKIIKINMPDYRKKR